VSDGHNKYDNYFDASIDALVTALTKAGFSDMNIIVGRAGWPTDGAVNATPSIAQSFMTGLVNHLARKSGTPLRPKFVPTEAYLYSLLDEDQHSITSGSYERHYGIFTFDGQAKYHVNLGQGPKALKNAVDVDYLPLKWCVVDMTPKIYPMLLLVFLPLAPTPTILLCRLMAPTQVLAGPGMCRLPSTVTVSSMIRVRRAAASVA
jgi:hypothetical protein